MSSVCLVPKYLVNGWIYRVLLNRVPLKGPRKNRTYFGGEYHHTPKKNWIFERLQQTKWDILEFKSNRRYCRNLNNKKAFKVPLEIFRGVAASSK